MKIRSQINKKNNQKKNTHKKKKDKKKRRQWTLKENQQYARFVLTHRIILEKPTRNQKQMIFNKMAFEVSTRNSRQCKSHHQKMLQRYGSYNQIELGILGNSEKNVSVDAKKKLAKISQMIQQNDFLFESGTYASIFSPEKSQAADELPALVRQQDLKSNYSNQKKIELKQILLDESHYYRGFINSIQEVEELF